MAKAFRKFKFSLAKLAHEALEEIWEAREAEKQKAKDEEALPKEKEDSNLRDRWWEKITDGIPAEKRRAIEKTLEQ